MSFASFVNNLSDALNKGIRDVVDSGIIPKTVGKTTRVGLNIGKPVARTGFKVGMSAINTGLDGANFIKDNYKAIGNGIKTVGEAVVKEGNEFVHAGAGVIEAIDRSPFIKKVGLDKSLIKRRVTGPGAALATGVALTMGAGKSTKEYIENRQGQNDGRLYRPTPQMGTPYQLSEQMAYSSHGRSFADNAGATGDLVFALNNMRHG